jgi:predicted TPR repeat methyltransferase
MQENLSYTTPTQLRALADETLSGEKMFQNGLDLGCGTGLSGEAFKDRVKRLTGVDLSPVMLRQAAEKGIYAALHEEELVDFLQHSKEKFDLILAADVFVYLGDLQPLFRQIKIHATPQALFLFSSEATEEDFILQASGRYAHSEKYIRNVAQETGFTVVKKRAANIRKEKGEWIRGNLYLLSV